MNRWFAVEERRKRVQMARPHVRLEREKEMFGGWQFEFETLVDELSV